MKITLRQPLSFSEIGRKDNQEDCIYPKTLTPGQRFFILCDGMGGHEHGEVASQAVCEAMGESLTQHYSTHTDITADDFNVALQAAFDALDERDSLEEVRKMGTTMTCVCLGDTGYLVAHIGDSRIYHVRPSEVDLSQNRRGILYQSSDHSLVNDLLKVGELTEEQAVNFPQKNIITRAMQPHLDRRPKADVFKFSDLASGDYFFLCCDGVLEKLTNDRLVEILSEEELTDEEKLAKIKAECDGQTRDNYTCILVPVNQVIMAKGEVASVSDDSIAAVDVATEDDELIVEDNTTSFAPGSVPTITSENEVAPAPTPSTPKADESASKPRPVTPTRPMPSPKPAPEAGAARPRPQQPKKSSLPYILIALLVALGVAAGFYYGMMAGSSADKGNSNEVVDKRDSLNNDANVDEEDIQDEDETTSEQSSSASQERGKTTLEVKTTIRKTNVVDEKPSTKVEPQQKPSTQNSAAKSDAPAKAKSGIANEIKNEKVGAKKENSLPHSLDGAPKASPAQSAPGDGVEADIAVPEGKKEATKPGVNKQSILDKANKGLNKPKEKDPDQTGLMNL